MSKFKLSLLYPTYNRAEIIGESLRSVIKCEREDVEFVVVDDCSPDNTSDVIDKIKDERISYYRNVKNLGYNNTYESIIKSRGEFSLLLSDECLVDYRKIDDIIRLCETHSDCGIIRLSADDHGEAYYRFEDELKKPGFPSINRTIGHGHMMGYVFNNRIAKKMIAQYWEIIKDASHPHICVAMLALQDHCLFTSSLCPIDEVLDGIGSNNAVCLPGEGKNIFTYEGRMIAQKKYIDVLGLLNLDKTDKVKLVLRLLLITYRFGVVSPMIMYSLSEADNIFTKDFRLNSDGVYNINIERRLEECFNTMVSYSEAIGVASSDDIFELLHNDEEWNEYYTSQKEVIVKEAIELQEHAIGGKGE